MALTKVSGGILDPGINVAGVVTAIGFDGPFIGGSEGINAGVGTFTGLDLNGNGDISGNLVIHGNLTANGDFTTLNTTLREVELLRVDANSTSTIAAGIITQTGAGHGLVLADDTTLKMAMNVGSGIATFRALNAGYGNHNSASGIFQQVDLNTAAVTFGNTISVNGATIAIGGNSHRIRSAANDFAIEHTTSSYKGFRFLGNVPENTLVVDDGNSGSVGIGSQIPSEKLDVSGTTKTQQLHVTGIATVGTGLSFGDSVPASFGDSNDLQIVHESGENHFLLNSGNTFFKGDVGWGVRNASNQNIIQVDGSTRFVDLYGSTNKVLSTTGVGVTVRSGLYIENAEFNMTTNGNKVLDFETGGSNGVYFRHNPSDGALSTFMQATHGGSLKLYDDSDGAVKLTTSGVGVTVFGNIMPETSGSLDIGSSSAGIGSVFLAEQKELNLEPTGAFKIYRGAGGGGANNFVHSTFGSIFIQAATGVVLKVNNSNHDALVAYSNDRVDIYYANNIKLTTTGVGVSVTGEVAASQDYPNYRPTLDFNFAAQKKLDTRITYTRTGVASFVNEFGKVVKVGDNAPRFDHDPMTRESKGLLIEESRTNVAESSEDFGNTSFWVPTSQTITTNVATAPDGTLTADNIIPASGNAALRYLYFSGSAYSMSTNTKYTTSIFVKKNGLRYFALQAHDNGSGSGHRAGFDLDNGTVVTSNNMGSGSNHSASIVEFPNGWFRCILTGTTAGSGSTGKTAFSFSSALDGNASVGGITADGSSGGYVWGHQVEAGAFATSYIPTTGSTITRGADLCQITGEDFSDFYNQDEGTIVTEHSITTGVASGDNTYVYQVDDGSDDNVGFRLIDHNSAHGDVLRAYGFLGGNWNSPQYGSQTSTPDHDSFLKVAVGVKKDDFGVNFFGGTTYTDTSGDINVDMTQITLGNHRGGTAPLQGHLKRFMYYPQKLTTNQLKTITS